MTGVALPSDSHTAATPYLQLALERTLSALEDPQAFDHLRRYYSVEGNFAGATFLDLGPSDPYTFTEADLLALTTLQVSLTPVAVRRFLVEGPRRDELNRAISEAALPVGADLRVADESVLAQMEACYRVVKPAVSASGLRRANAWVTASKLCARKRPHLFPVRDSVVCRYLGILRADDYRIDWQVFRHLVQSAEVIKRLEGLVDEVASLDGVHVGQVDSLLRHLDVVLWMHARRGL